MLLREIMVKSKTLFCCHSINENFFFFACHHISYRRLKMKSTSRRQSFRGPIYFLNRFRKNGVVCSCLTMCVVKLERLRQTSLFRVKLVPTSRNTICYPFPSPSAVYRIHEQKKETRHLLLNKSLTMGMNRLARISCRGLSGLNGLNGLTLGRTKSRGTTASRKRERAF